MCGWTPARVILSMGVAEGEFDERKETAPKRENWKKTIKQVHLIVLYVLRIVFVIQLNLTFNVNLPIWWFESFRLLFISIWLGRMKLWLFPLQRFVFCVQNNIGTLENNSKKCWMPFTCQNFETKAYQVQVYVLNIHPDVRCKCMELSSIHRW